jgi:hypothetical protein
MESKLFTLSPRERAVKHKLFALAPRERALKQALLLRLGEG